MEEPTKIVTNLNFKDRGFTDQLYWLNFKCTWIFVVVCIIVTCLSGYLNITDLSLVSYGIPAAFAELGVHTGYIIWKAKSENLNKHPVVIDPDGTANTVTTQVIGFEYEGDTTDDEE